MLMSRDDIARLCTHLVVPVAVGDILHRNSPVVDEIQYGMHEILSNMEPDTALIAIAISAQHIAVRYTPDNPMAIALALESEKIVEDYAPDWLDYVDGRGVSRTAEEIMAMLNNVPEDLEVLADLLSSVQGNIDDEQDPAWNLADILILQAKAHIEIAEYILGHSNGEAEGSEGGAFPSLDAISGNNVVMFPGAPA